MDNGCVMLRTVRPGRTGTWGGVKPRDACYAHLVGQAAQQVRQLRVCCRAVQVRARL
jgi:hypothetical protein